MSSVSDATLQATVTAPSLAQVQGSGSSRVHLQDRLAGDELRVELSGASRLDGPVDLTSATAALSGASQLELSGRAGSVNASASGASHLVLRHLQVDALEVSWSLLATRSHTWNESFARAQMLLSVLAASVIALALVAQATGFGSGFTAFALVLLPVVLLLGVTTYIRLVQAYRSGRNVQTCSRMLAVRTSGPTGRPAPWGPGR